MVGVCEFRRGLIRSLGYGVGGGMPMVEVPWNLKLTGTDSSSQNYKSSGKQDLGG